MIYYFDIDGTLCKTEGNDYKRSEPIIERIELLNQLHAEGHRIGILTARGSGSGIDWRNFTDRQLKNWGLKFHALQMGKPTADLFVDDRGVNSDVFFEKYLQRVK